MPDLSALAARRERLQERCAQQRKDLAAALHDLRQPIEAVDRVLACVRFLRAHPLLLVAGVATLTALRRRDLFSLAIRGVAAWRAWRAISGWIDRAGAGRWLRARRAEHR